MNDNGWEETCMGYGILTRNRPQVNCVGWEETGIAWRIPRRKRL